MGAILKTEICHCKLTSINDLYAASKVYTKEAKCNTATTEVCSHNKDEEPRIEVSRIHPIPLKEKVREETYPPLREAEDEETSFPTRKKNRRTLDNRPAT